MNTPNPLIPQGSQQHLDAGKTNVRVIVFTILAIHIIFLGGFLNQGCKPSKEQDQADVESVGIEDFPELPTSFDSSNSLAGNLDDQYHDSFPDPNGLGMDSDAVTVTETPLSNNIPPTPKITTPTNPLSLLAADERENFLEKDAVEPEASSAEDTGSSRTEFVEHTVARGDSFYKIAKKYNVDPKAVVKANSQLDPRRLQIGMKVLVPKTSSTATTATQVASSRSTETASDKKTYEVKRGDTLTRIAGRQGTTVAALRRVNNISGDLIRPGQKLIIPNP